MCAGVLSSCVLRVSREANGPLCVCIEPRRYSVRVSPDEPLVHDAARTGDGRLFTGQAPTVDSEFGALHELETLATAHRFFEWIVHEFGGAIGPRTLEVGAGLGTVSRTIARMHPMTEVLSLEPAANVYPRLAERTRDVARVTIRHCTSADLVSSEPERRFDTAVYVNVLEHIADDIGELRTASKLLDHGGRLCLFVPAMPSLYSRIDEKSGHYRRYTKAGLRRVVEEARFRVDRIDYFDVASVLPYWLVYRLLRVENLGSGSNAAFDRLLVPTSRAIQRVLRHPPFGKNLLLTATLAL